MKEITVAVVQSIARPGDLSRAVSDHARLSIQAAHRGARLAVFPELSLTGYSLALTRTDALTPDDPRLQMLRQIADANDIMIVAPYNAQVALIAGRLPGARVGTVDKFQGQEAPVVFYSMTTSSPEDAPRGMEFLYSSNRLNVAT